MVDEAAQVTAKNQLRDAIRRQRRDRTTAERAAARKAVRHQVLAGLDRLQLAAGTIVAGYEPLPSEPGSYELLEDLTARDLGVLVPITLPSKDLSWREYRLDAAATGLAEHALGVEAIGLAAVILLPGFAVDRRGNRLGRGGGSYDRALARAAPEAMTVALLFDGEIVDQVPTDPWDLPVRAAVTPRGWIELA